MPRTPTIGVLALQGDVREHVLALELSRARARGIRRPGELDDVDGVLIPGGESTTIWKLAQSLDLFEPMTKLIAGGMPAFGTCAGMIMLADQVMDGLPGQATFGGIDMVVRRNAFGRQVDSCEADVTLSSFADPAFHAVFIRAPWVESVGSTVEVLGTVPVHSAKADRSDSAVVRIVAVRQGNLLATAFHPELTPDRRIHELFVDIVKGRS